MFLPMTLPEIAHLGWDRLDIILVTGDCYIDSPHIGVSLIGKVLVSAGFRVGIIAQPDVNSSDDIMKLGAPRLFWGVTGGSVDSMVANYTALKKRRNNDDYTPGGVNNMRPDRAVIVYTNLIRRYFKPSPPIVLGGIEASLRRISHYDFWSNSIRRSILFDAKADYLLYGMAEKSIIELANALDSGNSPDNIRGLCRIDASPPPEYIGIHSHESAATDKNLFTEMFQHFYSQLDPISAQGMAQQHGNRWLIHNPPQFPLRTTEIDQLYDGDFERSPHPIYTNSGKVPAMDTIRFSISTHRGCYGECNFCGIAVHQGRTVQSRSENSILNEASSLTAQPDFKGYITLGGAPTANMYGFECSRKHRSGACCDKRCLFPEVCEELPVNHSRQTHLLDKIRNLQQVKRVFVTSGIRYDMVLSDTRAGESYLEDLVEFSISGQMKIAPEHSDGSVLELMGKPESAGLLKFKQKFDRIARRKGIKSFLTYYLIAAHPGCSEKEMLSLKRIAHERLGLTPEQVQIFTPLPSTWSAVMYYTERNPFNGKQIFVEKDPMRKAKQKSIITSQSHR